jgi:hypothetical protein
MAIGAAVNVGQILGLASGAEHGKAATVTYLLRNAVIGN